MLAVYLYRQAKKKRESRRQGPVATSPPAEPAQQDVQPTTNAADDSPSPKSHVEQSSKSTKSVIVWRLMLMLALAIPIFLETLDYTGKSTLTSQLATLRVLCL